MAEQMTGGCACGRVRYAAAVEDEEAYLCHPNVPASDRK